MFVFVDIETTGLDPQKHVILEIAVLITDQWLEQIDAKSFVVKQDSVVIDKPWIAENHGQLISECLGPDAKTLAEVDKELYLMVNRATKGKKVPICGNSVHFDRRFLELQVPEFMKLFNHRNIDVSSFREAFKEYGGDIKPMVVDKVAHRALADCESSVKQLKYYLKNVN